MGGHATESLWFCADIVEMSIFHIDAFYSSLCAGKYMNDKMNDLFVFP